MYTHLNASRFLSETKKLAYNRNLVWVYVVSESLGIGCMAMFAAFPSTIMESTTMGRAPEARAPLWIHNGALKGGTHSHATYPQRLTYNIYPHQVPVVGSFFVFAQKTTFDILRRTHQQKLTFASIFHQKSPHMDIYEPISDHT